MTNPQTIKAMTREEFNSLTPHNRGYTVYMAGNKEDQPNIPNEKTSPYPKGSKEDKQYGEGQMEAVLEVQDDP